MGPLTESRAWVNSTGKARLASHLRTPLYRNAYALIASAAATSGLGMVFWVLAARYYPAEAVGLNSAAVAAVTLLAGVSQLSLNNALVRYIPVAGRATGRLVGRAYLLCAAVATAAALAFYAGLGWWAPALRSLAGEPIWLLGFVFINVSWCLFALQDSVLTGLRRAAWVPVENTLFALVRIGLLVALAGVWPSHGIFVAAAVPIVLALVPVGFLVFRRLIPEHARAAGGPGAGPAIRPQQVAEFVAGNYVGSLFFLAATNLLPILVASLAGAAANAYFYLPWMIFVNLQMVALNMAVSLTVEASLDRERLAAHAYRALRHTARLLVPLAAAVALGAPYLLRAFGREYAAEGAGLLRLLALALIPNVAVALSLGLARAQNRVGAIILIQASVCLLLLGFSLAWLPRLGITAVGWASLAGQGLVAAYLSAAWLWPIARRGRRAALSASGGASDPGARTESA
jgi:O-antigen/teichoic acid export membrane protein